MLCNFIMVFSQLHCETSSFKRWVTRRQEIIYLLL